MISSYFWQAYFLRYGHFVEYMNMHAMNMQCHGGCGSGLDFAYRLMAADRRPFLMITGTRVWTLNPSLYNGENEVGPDSRHTCAILYLHCQKKC